ncbi:MAG: DUF6493 family protein [Mycobacteriales bacterium]
MATLPDTPLHRALVAGDPDQVVAVLDGATEAERRACADMIAHWTQLRAQRPYSADLDSADVALALAVLGTASTARKAAGIFGGPVLWLSLRRPEDCAAAIRVLAARRPRWLPDFPAALFAGRVGMETTWKLVRGLVRAGLAQLAPDDPRYLRCMPIGLGWIDFRDTTTLRDRLLDDPDLLTDEVYRLFDHVECVTAIASHDRWVTTATRLPGDVAPAERSWRHTLARLVAEGRLDRDRLLDRCLDGLTRDYPADRLSWLGAFLAELDPAIGEVAAREAAYRGLLRAAASAPVGVGQRALGALRKAGRLDVAAFVAASVAPLARTEKKLVTAQLDLLDRIARADPGYAGEVGRAAAVALGHPRVDVQEAALAVVRRHCPEALTAEVVEDLAPALRATLAPPPATPAAATVEVRVPPPADPPTGPGAPAPDPVTDPDELIDLFGRLLHRIDDPLDAERALAGAVRLASLPVEDRKVLAKPVLAHAGALDRSGLVGHSIRDDLAMVLYCWATPSRIPPLPRRYAPDVVSLHYGVDHEYRPVTLTGLFSARAVEAIHLISSFRPAVLLSEPTTRRGALDPAVFLARVAGRADAGPVDAAQAALRLPPEVDGDDSFWRELAALEPGTVPALRGLLELRRRVPDLTVRVGTPTRLGPPMLYWQGAGADGPPRLRYDRYSMPLEPTVVLAGYDGENPDRHDDPWGLWHGLGDPHAGYLRMAGRAGMRSDGSGWWPVAAPWHPEVVAAHLLRPLSRSLHGNEPQARTALSALSDPDTALGPVACAALAVGLVSGDAVVRAAAVDLLIAAAGDGRLVPERLATALVTLGGGGLVRANRLAEGLQAAAGEPLPAYRVAETLWLALPGLHAAGVSQLHLLLALAADLAARVHVPGDPPLADLAARKAGTRLATEARRLHATRPATLAETERAARAAAAVGPARGAGAERRGAERGADVRDGVGVPAGGGG